MPFVPVDVSFVLHRRKRIETGIRNVEVKNHKLYTWYEAFSTEEPPPGPCPPMQGGETPGAT